MKILICICTYNRNLQLKKCIESFKKAFIPTNLEIKFLIIDNSINNHSFKLINILKKKIKFSISYFNEPKRGIVYARNKALKESKKIKSDFTAFFDDDCVIDKFWFKNIKKLLNKFPIITGPQIYKKSRTNEENLSIFFEKKYKTKLQTVDWAATNNVIIKSNILKYSKLKFDFNLNKFSMGEDQLFFKKLNKMGYKIIWSKDLKVYEEYHKKRSNITEVLQRSYRLGVLGHYIDKQIYGNFIGLILNYFKSFYFLILGILKIFKITDNNYLLNLSDNFLRFYGRVIGPIIFKKINFYKK